MKEKDFCTAVVNSLKAHGAYAYKIPDLPVSYGSEKMRFSRGKNFDIQAVYKGVPLAIECKFYKAFKGFGITQLRDEQVEALEKFNQAGGKSFVFLNIWIPRQENRLLIWEWSDFKFRCDFVGSCIPKQEIINTPYLSGHKGQYNLFTWLSELTEPELRRA